MLQNPMTVAECSSAARETFGGINGCRRGLSSSIEMISRDGIPLTQTLALSLHCVEALTAVHPAPADGRHKDLKQGTIP